MRIRGGKDIITCPACGYRFSITYSRTFACAGCALASTGCRYIKCPKCGHEFELKY